MIKQPDINVYKLRPVRYVFKKAHSVVLPGVDGATLYEVSKFFVQEIRKVRLTERAAAVTYNFIMAMPPTFLFIFSLVPYLPLKNVQQTILSTLKLVTPNQRIYSSVSGIIRDFMGKQHHDVLSIGILMVLFFSSNGMMGLMKSFDRSEVLYKKRTGLQRRWMAIKLTVMLILVAVLTLAVLVLQNKSLNKLLLKIFPHLVAVKILSITILILIVFFTFCFIYRYGPSLKHKLKFITAGSVFATLASMLATSVFFFLVNNFLNYNKVYGSIGTLIAFMVLVWLNTVIILLGYELNISILLGKLSQDASYEEEV
ncbi:hypothetical protein CJD36_002805 [Flavipsychrobacter stenotrophus]|uniref:YihY/virulence factor BrkB family protein n=1 Tax=Flavipsychrobacter stenotrophus TaxID=2077091 RepID=A0A2S7T1E5_9BACT|nr:YihY/virulence factor BrkB family protein [Flavipsychrobacter stenotrophus]PQJ12691.1 hypothetical protein CJD36_002805 [Flavipsychrobacter stenotrophus]